MTPMLVDGGRNTFNTGSMNNTLPNPAKPRRNPPATVTGTRTANINARESITAELAQNTNARQSDNLCHCRILVRQVNEKPRTHYAGDVRQNTENQQPHGSRPCLAGQFGHVVTQRDFSHHCGKS